MANDLATIETQLNFMAPQLSDALAGIMPVERLIRTVVISIERLPALLNADRQSIFMAATSAACLGLEVDGVTGQAYIIPFKRMAQLVIGYKGFNTMAARGGVTISGDVVREGDDFDFQKGSGAFVRHKPDLRGQRERRIIAAYAVAEHRERPAVVEVLGIDEIMAVKAKSPGASRSDSPWNDPAIGFPAMAGKTAKRRLWRSLPLVPAFHAFAQAARMDEAFDEQGIPGRVDPARGFVEIQAQPATPYQDSPTPAIEQLIAGEEDEALYRSLVDMKIEDLTAEELGAWWNSPEQKAERRRFRDGFRLDMQTKVREAAEAKRATVSRGTPEGVADGA